VGGGGCIGSPPPLVLVGILPPVAIWELGLPLWKNFRVVIGGHLWSLIRTRATRVDLRLRLSPEGGYSASDFEWLRAWEGTG